MFVQRVSGKEGVPNASMRVVRCSGLIPARNFLCKRGILVRIF